MTTEPGERAHAAYRRHFRHRYGGNAPGWRNITEQERDLWGAVEQDILHPPEPPEPPRAPLSTIPPTSQGRRPK